MENTFFPSHHMTGNPETATMQTIQKFLSTVPNAIRRELYVQERKHLFLATVLNATTRNFDLGMRKKSSPWSRTRTCGKTPTMETIGISKQRPRCFMQSEHKPFSLPSLLSSFSFSLTLYAFVILSFFHYSATLELPNVTPLSGKDPILDFSTSLNYLACTFVEKISSKI